MRYAKLGNTGLIVSRMGFGAFTFTQGNTSLGAVYKVGAELADQLVGQCLDAGVTLFDTADVYADGESETLLGRALKPHRQKVIITSKVGNRAGANRELTQGNLSRRSILDSIDSSLKRLGTDYLDLYVAHREDVHTPLEETLEAFDTVVRQGKVRYIGYSNWSAWKAATAMEMQKANGWARFSHGQMYYSLLGRDIERDIIPMMQHHGLGLTIWSPLAYGFLAGAYSREDLSRPDNRFSNFDNLHFDKDQGFALLDVMRDIASARGISMAQLALAWLLEQSAVSSVLIGATKESQLQDNLGAADLRLLPEDMARLEAATALTPQYGTTHWVTPDYKATKALGLT